MKEQQQTIRNEHFHDISSAKRYLKIFIPDFAFKHDDNNIGKDKFVGREIQLRRLYTWLTSDSKSGSYLITGYRGMGKSLLVKRVIEMISREPKAYKEVLFQVVMVITLASCFSFMALGAWLPMAILMPIAMLIVMALEVSKWFNYILYEYHIHKFPLYGIFNKDMITKVWMKINDRRKRNYSTIAITVNLGQEVLHERDVLSLVAQNVREKYHKYVHNRQNRPFTSFLYVLISCMAVFCLCRYLILPVSGVWIEYFLSTVSPQDSVISSLLASILMWIWNVLFSEGLAWVALRILFYLLIYHLFVKLLKVLRKKIPYFSVPFNALERLDMLCDRISSSLNEEQGARPQYSSSLLNFSFGKEGKSKSTPKATVRELEQEMLGIINSINGDDCPKSYQVQFIIVFDELDKITKASNNKEQAKEKNEEGDLPEFDSSVKGFTDAMAYEERKENVLRLLANMKLFIASVKAKCVFISGHELYDASLADLSDREFAISSIFNGVLNVSSFLSPEREQIDVNSMTEVYLATMLLPERYLQKKIKQNAYENGILKEEIPSLRWYNEYLMDEHVIKDMANCDKPAIRKRVEEIRHVMEFMRCFCVYLSHISNGSPKKIATYFEKYVKVNYDAIRQFDWHDEIVVGKPTEKDVRKQCVLYFDASAQRLINFIHYIASPVLNAVTNEVSHYGDKLLVASSFMLDHVYKYHGKGFSWRNLEQMPEFLNTNKTPELRDSMSSIMEFLLQTHISIISSGIFQYKFHRQMAEEISILSKSSEEAAAIFNFTLNESETVKRYNTRLLWNYLDLSARNRQEGKDNHYEVVLERIHENLGDIYFAEEDYYRAIHEYRSALRYITINNITANNLLSYLKCGLKIGMAYEYRHTFENAYMIYCQIINKLVDMRWVNESELGLDYTMRLTHDWRVKQTLLLDSGSLQGWFSYLDNSDIRKQFHSGLWEDLHKENPTFKSSYSIDSDKTISSFAGNYTPEKSNLFLKLTVFEDVKYIYQAIIAKLFVIEKMESSGITQSSIDAAEAEFITLYCATNHKEKYLMAADFFIKLAGILYYKNNIVSSDPVDNVLSSLYVYDFNLLALLDDYCFMEHRKDRNNDAVKIKDNIRSFFAKLKTIDIPEAKKCLDLANNATSKDEIINILKKDDDDFCYDDISGYLGYLDNNGIGNIELFWSKMKECDERRRAMADTGHRLPCNACKYANRSLLILLNKMLEEDPYNLDVNESKIMPLLRHTSHKRIRFARPEHISLLASSSEQVADIMLSCACTNTCKDEDSPKFSDSIGNAALVLLQTLTGDTLTENDRADKMKEFSSNTSNGNNISRLDRSLLYYWVACRYYEISSMYHEATHCIMRMAKVVELYLDVVCEKHLNKEEGIDAVVKNAREDMNTIVALLENLFKQASRMIGHQYDNSNMMEIREYKWIFHYEFSDEVDLTRLTQFPDLQPLFLSIISIKQDLFLITDNSQEQAKLITETFHRLTPSLRHERTFKSTVEMNYFKAKTNHIIFIALLKGRDEMRDFRNKWYNGNRVGYYQLFYDALRGYLKEDKLTYYETDLFKINGNVQSKLDLLDFLVCDSSLCLYNIIKEMPPHNRISTFSDSFIADVYERLWEWSKYYEMLYNMYLFYRYYLESNENGMKDLLKKVPGKEVDTFEKLFETMKTYARAMSEAQVLCEDNFGYRYSKLFMNLRHEMDDSTMHHIYTNYSAEMAIKHYRNARGINSEGTEYKNLIYGMFVLDDDLHNDTCQSNLADERYYLNSGIISKRRKKLQNIYDNTTVNLIKSYDSPIKSTQTTDPISWLQNRYKDSIYLNSEY